MSETQKLLREIEAFLETAGMAETTFGRQSVNDGKLVRRLYDGGSVTLDKASEIRRFIARELQRSARSAGCCLRGRVMLNAMDDVLAEARTPSFSRMADAIRAGNDEVGQREFQRLVSAAIRNDRAMTKRGFA